MPVGVYVLDKTHASITGRGLHQGFSFHTFRFAKFDPDFTYGGMA